MKFPEKGLNYFRVLEELSEKYELDAKHVYGEVMGSMTSIPSPIALEAFRMFWFSNLNDPFTFPGSHLIEKLVINSLANLYKCEENCDGIITTSGSESNLTALYLLREQGHKVIAVPASAHYSVFKACKILNIEAYKISLNSNFKADVGDIEKALHKEIRAFVLTAGTTEFGLVEEVDTINNLIKEYEGKMHVDAAFGGFLIPFLRELGYSLPEVSFKLESVQTITLDAHKTGFTPIPCNTLLVKPSTLMKKYLKFPAKYMPLGYQYGLFGTRTAGSAASLYAIIKYYGKEGFKKIILRIMEILKLFIKRLEEEGFEVPVKPELPIVCIKVSNPNRYVKELSKRRFYVYKCSLVKGIRVVLLPHINENHLEKFIDYLKELKRELK